MAPPHSFLLVCWALWASLVCSSPVRPLIARQAPSNASSNSSEACAEVSASVAAQLPKDTAAAATAPLPTVSAQVAWDCMQSVPLNKSAAQDLVKAVKPFLEWQSTTAFLKNPPQEYADKIQAPVDFMAMFQNVSDNLDNDVYKNEYQFGFDLYRVTASTHDGHFNFIPDSVGNVFAWSRTTPLVSVSEDGKMLPVPFAFQDVLQASFSNSTYQPSRIMKINGKDATQFLEDESQNGNLQDRDALYNNMFYELAQIALNGQGTGRGAFAGGGPGRFYYPGPDTTLEFANGTTKTYPNIARVIQNFTGVTDGPSLYKTYFVTPPNVTIDLVNDPTSTPGSTPTPTSTSSSTSSSATVTATAIPAPGYPQPVLRQSENLNGGYYLSEVGYQDVAVLNVASFVGDDTSEVEFQQINTDFIKQAKADGKTKMVIDVSANGGGTILQGYDLFKQFFPQMEPFGASRLRAHEAANTVGETFSNAANGFNRSVSLANDNIIGVIASPFNFRQDINIEGDHFTDWNNKYEPREINNDNFTGEFRWDLNDPLTVLNSGGINVTGFGNRTNFSQPFAPENIVIVYDGYCASTCTLFSEMMRQQGGVKTIAFGGRANNDIIQAVGGVKGANNFPWEFIQSMAETSFNFSNTETRQQMSKTELGQLTNYLPFLRSVGEPNVNARDAIRQGDNSGTPLQFRYEPADCRIFYTAEMTMDISASWRAAADSMWGKTDHCVAGSLQRTGSTAKEGLIGQSPNENKKKEKRMVTKMSNKVTLKKQLVDTEFNSLLGSLETFTDQVSKFGKAQGYMAP